MNGCNGVTTMTMNGCNGVKEYDNGHYTQLTICQKKEIAKERKMRMQRGQKCSQPLLAEWAKERFGLSAVPGKATMSRIWNDASLNESESNRHHNQIRKTGPRNAELDRAIYNWVCDMRNSRKCVSGAMIREKASRLSQKVNEQMPDDEKINLSFSEGWLQKFKARWALKEFKLHGEAGDVEQSTIDNSIDKLRAKVSEYNLKNVFNCDESGLFYQMAPDRTISPSTFAGRKSQKTRFTFLACCNADGTERLPLMFIGISEKPRCFKKKSGQQLGLYYRNNKKAWMTGALFHEWLLYLDRTISKTTGRKILLLLDNCSAHGTKETLPTLSHVEVFHLPPNTTSRLQPLDLGIIAAMKVKYRRCQMEYAVDLLDEDVRDVYKVDILTAMFWISNIWKTISDETIRNCWGTTGIVPAYECVYENTTNDLDAQDRTDLHDFIQRVVPVSRRLSVDDLLCFDQEIECTQVLSEEETVGEIIAACSPDNEDDEDDISPEIIELGSLNEQLKCVSYVKRIIDSRPGLSTSDAVMQEICRIQVELRKERVDSLEQTHIENFFMQR